MKKLVFLLFTLFALVASIVQILAVEPVVTVKKVDFEAIEGKNNIMTALLDSYKKAAMLESQVKSLDEQPVAMVPILPDYRELDEKGSSKLRDIASQYHAIALALNKQVLELPEQAERVGDLKKKVRATQDELTKERKKVFEANNYCYEEKMKIINEMNGKCEGYLKGMSEQYEQNYKNSIEILSASVVGYKMFSMIPNVESDLSLGARVELNAYSLVHFGKNFEFWAEYQNPLISTISNQTGLVPTSLRWNIDFYSAGISVVLPHLFPLFSNTDVGLKLGAGHYWGNGKVYNGGVSSVGIKGEQLRFEANVVKYKWFFPIELFFAGNINFSRNEVVFFTGLEQINYGRAFPNSISMGIRLCLWWHPNIQDSAMD